MPRICLKPPWVRTRSKVWAVKHTMSYNVQGDSNKDGTEKEREVERGRKRERDIYSRQQNIIPSAHSCSTLFVIIVFQEKIFRYN